MATEVEAKRRERRHVQARLVEATPRANGLGYWVLSAPTVIFLGWLWVDLIAFISPIPSRPLELLFAALVYVVLVILPFGYGAHRLVTAFPRVFQQAGWTVHSLEPLRPAEQYTAKYTFVSRTRAATDLRRVLLRVAQGWVYLEIAIVLVGAAVMVPLFFSAVEFGFGR